MAQVPRARPTCRGTEIDTASGSEGDSEGDTSEAPPPPLNQSRFMMLRNASCDSCTLPKFFMRFLPSFCLSSSLRLRVMSPPY